MFKKYGPWQGQGGQGRYGWGREGWHFEGGQRFGGRSFGGPHGRRGPGGPGGDGPFDGDGGGRRRHRRGDIRYALLALVAEQPRHGYELIKALEERSAGFYRPSPGSVYPTLQLLEDEGHLTSTTVEGKRTYTITESGQALLAARQHEAGGHRRDHRDHRDHGQDQDGPPLAALRQGMVGLAASVQQAARHGSPAQQQAVLALLDATRRQVYAILATTEAEQQAGATPES